MIAIMPGMNNLVEDLDLQDKWVQVAQNCRYEPEPGAVSKRDPVSYYNTSNTGAGGVLGLYRFYTDLHDVAAWIAQADSPFTQFACVSLEQGARNRRSTLTVRQTQTTFAAQASHPLLRSVERCRAIRLS